jgi:gas vesicle protein
MARKPSTWAEEAGKYYRKNVGKNGIESFTDVLKSDDFKKQYYAKNDMKRGGEGEAASVAAPANTTAVGPAPANTTAVEIQVPLNSVMGVMKTGGMKKKSKSMKMKKKGKMTKKKSLKNNKKKRITKKYMGGQEGDVRCFQEIDKEDNNISKVKKTLSNTLSNTFNQFKNNISHNDKKTDNNQIDANKNNQIYSNNPIYTKNGSF